MPGVWDKRRDNVWDLGLYVGQWSRQIRALETNAEVNVPAQSRPGARTLPSEGTHFMSTSKALGIVKLTGLLTLVAGIVMIVAGGVTWGMVSSQLRAEHITVSDDAPFAVGATVAGPISAFAQAEVINKHALAATEGKTYAELGALVNAARDAGDEELATELQGQRTTIMNGSFLRASLFTSVVAFGVAALVMGLGLVLVLVGISLSRLAAAEPVPARVAVSNE